MPLICFGPICIPVSFLYPFLLFLIKPLWQLIENKWPHVNDYLVVKKFHEWFGPKKVDLVKKTAHVRKEITEDEFGIITLADESDWNEVNERSKSLSKPVIVKWTSDFCKPCKKILPFYQTLSKEFKDSAFFVIADITKVESVAQSCGVVVLPCFQVHSNGTQVFSENAPKEDRLREIVEKYVSKTK
eukprot:c21288_g2_i1.p1 GENE.c21288_g2_i1~~c21288_g2_i1.p1  ORF type:complete len:187 (+),score=58.14 c21288_g2_i1:23-583(+)